MIEIREIYCSNQINDTRIPIVEKYSSDAGELNKIIEGKQVSGFSNHFNLTQFTCLEMASEISPSQIQRIGFVPVA